MFRSLLLGLGTLAAAPAASSFSHRIVPSQPDGRSSPATIAVELDEWTVTLDSPNVAAGPVVFHVHNAGTIPHAFEVEGKGVERETGPIAPGDSGTLSMNLRAGHYEVYCPIGHDSHRKLGMQADLDAGSSSETGRGAGYGQDTGEHRERDSTGTDKLIRVTGGGPVIQILPGPFPLADSAATVIKQRPADQQKDLLAKTRNGPYSNHVKRIEGTIRLTAWERGAVRDSVEGEASFSTSDGARWRLVLDTVQTRDIPFNPRFGGVIMGLYYHGASGVHTPLVPTITSKVALWAWARLYRGGALVTDRAMVHIMLLSRTRRNGDFALSCWDCSMNPIEELQLQVTPPPGAAPFPAPGGVLFLNWEKSGGES